MPRDLFVENNPLTVFVYLDDRITPTQLRLNMSQLIRSFRRVEIAPSERLIWEHKKCPPSRYSHQRFSAIWPDLGFLDAVQLT
jgi:hypothetical protein